MAFTLSKLFWAAVAPATLLLALLLVGVLLLWLTPARAQRLGRLLISLAVGGFLLAALFPLERLYLAPLEQRFPAASLPERVDGVVVLGGGFGYVETADGPAVEPNQAGERAMALLALARLYPEARLVYSGGSGSLRDQERREAPFAADLLASWGLPRERLLLESESRNTRENAVYSQALAQPAPGEVWLLVTSASHLPRAVGTFRAVGWEVVPVAVDHLVRVRGWLSFDLSPVEGLALANVAAYEWIGLLAYRLLGWSDSLFPGPR